MPYEWEQHISRFGVYQWLNWTHANTKNLLKQSWRKDNPAYADSYKRAELHDATLNDVKSWLQHGTIHPSPNFAIWRDYWLWWSIVMVYGYNADNFDAPGMDSTFQRWMKQLRLARDMMLGVQGEPPLGYVSPLAQSLQNMQQLDLPDNFFDKDNGAWREQLAEYRVA